MTKATNNKETDNRLNRLNSANLSYLKKAQMVLKSKQVQDIVKETGIPSEDVKAIANRKQLDMAKWLDVMLLADYYDRILPRLGELGQENLQKGSLVIDGRLFTEPRYQRMTTSAKLIYSYLTTPSQERYRDESGQEFVICYLDDLKRLTNHTKRAVEKALMELQDHELLMNYESKKTQPQRFYIVSIKETEE